MPCSSPARARACRVGRSTTCRARLSSVSASSRRASSAPRSCRSERPASSCAWLACGWAGACARESPPSTESASPAGPSWKLAREPPSVASSSRAPDATRPGSAPPPAPRRTLRRMSRGNRLAGRARCAARGIRLRGRPDRLSRRDVRRAVRRRLPIHRGVLSSSRDRRPLAAAPRFLRRDRPQRRRGQLRRLECARARDRQAARRAAGATAASRLRLRVCRRHVRHALVGSASDDDSCDDDGSDLRRDAAEDETKRRRPRTAGRRAGGARPPAPVAAEALWLRPSARSSTAAARGRAPSARGAAPAGSARGCCSPCTRAGARARCAARRATAVRRAAC